MTQEFHISVTPVGSDEYLVRTERVAPGVPLAEEQVVWEVDQWLTYTQQLMNSPLLELLQGNGTRVGGFEFFPRNPSSGNGSHTPPTLLELGQTLYNCLFQGTLRDSWMTARGIAQHKGEMLRLRLGLKGAKLPRLPWEVLNAGEKDGIGTLRRPIATGTDIVFSRYQPGINMTGGYGSPLEPGQPVRVLMAIAAPTDQERLQLREEALHLQQELSQHRPAADGTQFPAPKFEVTVLDQPGREQLTQALEQGYYHVLHYAGHSNLGAAGGDLYLVNERTGLTEVLNGDDLAGLLVNNGVRMVVFNSCRGSHSAQTMADFPERNLAEALVSRGIPAVLAMAERIPDDVALNLTRLFYRNLKQGYPLDLSLSRARQGLISSYGSNQLFWALPVLYMHPEWDGYLVPGDRSRLNPADHLLLMPQVYDTPPKLAGEDLPTPEPDTALANSDEELEMISRAVLEDSDTAQTPAPPLVQDADFDPLEDDLGVSQTGVSTAELLQQLSVETPPVEIPEVEIPEVETPDRPTPAPNAYPLLDWDAEEPEPLTSGEGETSATPPMPASMLPPEKVSVSTASADTAPTDRAVQDAPSRSGSMSRSAPRKVRMAYLVLPLVGAAMMVGAVVVTNWMGRSPSPGDLLPGLPSPEAANNTPDTPLPDTTANDELTARAIEGFQQDNLPAAIAAVTELLNRGDLQNAQMALSLVEQQEGVDPELLFVRGRLAWQQIQQGNDLYSVDDARRAWEFAIAKDDTTAKYHMALGFALYAEEKFAEATQSWCRAIQLIETPGSPPEDPQCRIPAEAVRDPIAQNAYAGTALAFYTVATTGDRSDADELRSRADEVYARLLRSDPQIATPTQLPNGWLWSEALMQDWRAFTEANGE